MSEETKVVITLRDKAVRVAMQQTDCDPILFQPIPIEAEDDLRTILGTPVNEFLEEARRRWQTSPRYPKAEVPAPPAPAPAATTVSRPAAPAKSTNQQAMF
ncbi:MAG: hypothetical protein PHQ43_15150 [Dehalococcoidales bacterium]|nr:hypothetical protein [Dehalococcoidales bacterium]